MRTQQVLVHPAVVALVVVGLLAIGCGSPSPIHATASDPVAASPACAPPELLLRGEANGLRWTGVAGVPTTVSGDAVLESRGNEVSSVELVVTTPAAAEAAPFDAERREAMARADLSGLRRGVGASVSLPVTVNSRGELPVVAVIRYAPAGCSFGGGGGSGEAVQTLGVLSVK